MRTSHVRRIVALSLTAVLALPLVGCTGSDTPPPDEAADALVEGLKEGSIAGLPLRQDTSGNPDEQLAAIVTPLLEATGAEQPDVRKVKVVQVEDSAAGDDVMPTATLTLEWSWPLGGDAVWSYLTQTDLVYYAPEDAQEDEQGFWQARFAPDVVVPELQPGEKVAVEEVAPKRADILDGTGEPLVTERDIYRIGVDKTRVAPEAWPQAATQLAEAVNASGVAAVDVAAYVTRVVEKTGEKAFVELLTVRTDETRLGTVSEIPGVLVLPGKALLAPTSTFARAILGKAGEATAEIIEKSEGRIKKGDITGISGLQKQYDAQLAGSPGITVTADNPDDPVAPRPLFTKEPVNGTPLQTTFDVGLQNRAEQVLSAVGPASAIVAIRPSTGEVLAAASGPGSQGLNTALLGKYAPGSTFKVVDALAFGRKGTTPDSVVPCTPTITVNGKEFQNVPGYDPGALGDVPFRTAFAHSCNTAMISQHDKVTQEEVVAAATDLGIGVPSGLGAAVFQGNVPTDATPAQHAATLIGQDRIEVSPFTMARVAASVAAGKRVDPVLVRPAEVVADDGDAEAGDDVAAGGTASPSPSPTESAEEEAPASKLTADEAATLRSLMGSVVDLGSAKALQDVPGIVGAKTGTAQFGDASQQHTWMIAIAGDLAVAVFVEVGDRGSSTSGPLMHAFLTGQ